MWATINQFVNTHIGTSILIGVFLFLVLFALIRTWCNLAAFFDDLYDDGWDHFVQLWKEWGWLKRISIVLMYIVLLIGFAVFVVFTVLAFFIALGSIMNFLKRKSII